MRRTVFRIVLAAALGALFAAGPGPAAPQAPRAEAPRATGLIPLDAAQLEEILAAWPRIVRVGLNPLGFERVNAVRSAKGKPALDPRLVAPIGDEVESARAAEIAGIQAASINEAAAGDLPVSVDNSLLRFFPPIRNQGQVGSCASFASTYVQLSYMTAFQRNLDIRNPADNTNKYSPKWSYNMLNGGEDNGTSLFQNYALLNKNGAATWAEFPYDTNYKAWCLNPAAWRNAIGVRTKPMQYLRDVSTGVGMELVQELLADGYVLVFGTYIDSWVYQAAADDPSTSADDTAVGRAVAYWQNGSEGSHAMTIVGYNDAVWTDINGNGVIDGGELGAFRVANSWGSWAPSGFPNDGGFLWLAYDALRNVSAVSGGPSTGRNPAIQGDLIYVLTARNGYAPLMTGEFTISHAKRDQLRLTLGRSDTTATYPSTTWTPSAFQNMGGAFAFDGSTSAVSGGFVLDFTDLLIEGAGAQRYYLGVNDSAAGDEATLESFRIVDRTTDPATETASALVPLTADRAQAYAYVDYMYPGPVSNNPPQLTAPQASPLTGTAGATYKFSVRYSDSDGDAPAVKDLILDGAASPLTLMSGQAPADGWYSTDLALPAGAHSFAFYFEDGRGESARAPLAGAISGPAVYGIMASSLSPSGANAGDPALMLAVNGADFADGAVVTWDGADRTTTFVSSERLNAAIAAADLAAGKSVPVVVRNPGGVLSNALTFTISNPHPILTSVSPSALTGGGSSAVLTLHGSNLVPGAVMRWNGFDRETVYVSSAEVRGTLTSADLSAAGDHQVTVGNPGPGGGWSLGRTFSVSGFTASATPPEVTVPSGGAAVYTIEISPHHGSFDSVVGLSCVGLPQGTTAAFSPVSVTPASGGASVTLTLRTTARKGLAASASAASPGDRLPPWPALLLAATGLAALACFLRCDVRPVGRRRLVAAALVLLAVGLAGCGAGGGPDSNDPGTPAGTHGVAIMAESGTLSAQASVRLIVR